MSSVLFKTVTTPVPAVGGVGTVRSIKSTGGLGT
jgi:hypothetical protein